MFRTYAIILSTQKIRDQFTRVIVFTKDFGKIHCWYKKSNVPDITTLCEIHIERERGFNSIKSFENISLQQGNQALKYEELVEFLRIFHLLSLVLPDSVENRGIFHDIQNSMQIPLAGGHKLQFYLLVQARILKKLGYLDENLFRLSPLGGYIYTHLDTKTIPELHQAKELDTETRSLIQRSILESQYRISYHP